PSGRISSRSAWVPAKTWRQLLHSLQPPSSHSSAAAKARAATERPDPGGPVNSQAWVIAPGSGGRPSSTKEAPAAARGGGGAAGGGGGGGAPVRRRRGGQDLFPDRGEVTGAGLGGRGHRVGEQYADPLLDLAGDLGGRPVGVQHQVPGGFGAGQGQETGPD